MYILVCKRCGSQAKQAKHLQKDVIVCSNPNCDHQYGEWVDFIEKRDFPDYAFTQEDCHACC